MQAVILAGGLGTRLRPVTERIPKVLVPVAGRPFLDWLVATLPRDLFTEVLLLVGYLGDQVCEYCGDGSRYGMTITYSQEPEPLGTAGALRFAADMLGDRFVLLNGDTYIELDYGDLLGFHTRMGATVTMVLARPYDLAILPNVRVEPDGRVSRYAKGVSAPDLNGIDGGVAVFDREVLRYIPEGGPRALEGGVFQALVVARQLAGYVTGNVYYDMGTDSGLRAVETLVEADGRCGDTPGSGQ